MHFKETGYEYVDYVHLARKEACYSQHDTEISCSIKTNNLLCTVSQSSFKEVLCST